MWSDLVSRSRQVEMIYRFRLTDTVSTTDGLNVHLRIEILVVAACAVANVRFCAFVT